MPQDFGSIEDVQVSNPPTVDEVAAWFREYPSIEAFLSPSAPNKASLVGIEFLEWFNIYARGRPQLAYICDLADGHNTCPALAWCWMTSELLTFEEFRDLILEGADCFHVKAGFMVYSPDHCHRFMGYCVQAVEDKAEQMTQRRAATSFARLHLSRHDQDDSFRDVSDC